MAQTQLCESLYCHFWIKCILAEWMNEWMNGSVNANRWREEFGLSKLPLESGSVWIARECVPFSIPSFFWWEWNVKWQILRQSSVCVSKVRLIQDEFWACQAQLYQPLLTLTELKKENIKRKDWHDEIISYESMQFINFFYFEEIHTDCKQKRWWKDWWMNVLISIHDIWFVSFYKITWLQKSPKHDPACSAQSSPAFFSLNDLFLPDGCPVRRMTHCMLEYGNGVPCSLFIEVKITLSHTVCTKTPYATVLSLLQWGQSANWHKTVLCPRT